VRKRVTLSVATAGLFALVATSLTACGASSSGSAGAQAGSDGGLTKSPYVLEVITMMTSVNPSTEAYEGAQAAAAAVNADGGINGHPLQVKVCNAGAGDGVAPAVACARNLVADSKVLAEVGDFQLYADQSNAILAAAKVPSIAPAPSSASVLSSKNTFPLSGSEGAGLGVALADAGAKRIQVAYTNVPQAAAALSFAKLTLGQGRGLTVEGGIPVDLTATDLTPQVTEGAKGDGVVLAMLPAQLSSWLNVVQSGGFTQKLAASAGALLPKELAVLGDKADGLVVASGLPIVTSSMPGVVRFRTEMAKYAPGQAVDGTSLNSWLGTWAFAQVARTMTGDLTRASVMSAFGNLTDFNVFGLLPQGFTTTKEFTLPGLNRLFNQMAIEGVIKDGKPVQTSPGYVSVFSRPTS
jgi:ABC-type branched-subunit amino acid transport system substrate-binding protein